jgi:YhcG PDDEXK nuclease domain
MQLADKVVGERMTESELDKSLLDRLQRFMLGRGHECCFVARQLRIAGSEEDESLDLLFFRRDLRCLVAVDMKLEDLVPEDLRQMHSHLNYLAQHVAHADENPPVGILLCAGRETEVVRLVITSDDECFVSRCQLGLPGANQLRQWLHEERQRITLPGASQCCKSGERSCAGKAAVASRTALG